MTTRQQGKMQASQEDSVHPLQDKYTSDIQRISRLIGAQDIMAAALPRPQRFSDQLL
jgi:hypothetical protein